MNKALLALSLFALCGSAVHAESKSDTAKAEPTKAQAAQHAKMKACNAEAKEKSLKGEARKNFMSECLKKKAS